MLVSIFHSTSSLEFHTLVSLCRNKLIGVLCQYLSGRIPPISMDFKQCECVMPWKIQNQTTLAGDIWQRWWWWWWRWWWWRGSIQQWGRRSSHAIQVGLIGWSGKHEMKVQSNPKQVFIIQFIPFQIWVCSARRWGERLQPAGAERWRTGKDNHVCKT